MLAIAPFSMRRSDGAPRDGEEAQVFFRSYSHRLDGAMAGRGLAHPCDAALFFEEFQVGEGLREGEA